MLKQIAVEQEKQGKLDGDAQNTGELDGEGLLAAHAADLQAYIARKKKYELYE